MSLLRCRIGIPDSEMAETSLYLALRKIRLASLEDNSSDQIGLPIFQSRLRRIESELRMILCFLDQLETRYNSNQVLVSWIAESQRLGYLVEETVDVFIHRLFRPSRSPGRRQLGICAPAWLIWGIFLTVEARRRAFVQLIELEEELQHLSKLKENWVQLATDPKRHYYYIPKTCETANVSGHELVSDFASEELVGFDVEDSGQLTARLQDNKDSASKVVAVWGPAGSGKTTLVRSVYEQQRRHFESHAWISMSGCSSAKDILTKILGELQLENGTTISNHSTVRRYAVQERDTDTEPLQQLMEALSNSGLPDKKFLIVLDDLKVRDGISEVLGLIESTSRVIIITRIETVAEIDEEKINLAGLEETKAVELFGKVVFGKGTKVSEELRDIYKNVMKTFSRCRSLPQVIVSLGATLCLNQSTNSAFQHVQDQLEWVSKYNSSLDDTHQCLYVAYINLPMHLKVCLLYCGIFPAGYLLHRKKLVRLWVAEGFIKKQRELQVEEDIAEDYVMALTSWGFLQHVVSDEPARVGANLRMPIVVHDLVQSISRKEGFGIASEDVELVQEDTNIRCLFTSKYPQDIRSLMHYLPHLRTLIVSETGVPEDQYIQNSVSHSGILSELLRLLLTEMAASLIGSRPQQRRRFSYLSVLELHGSSLEYLPYGIYGLFNLRYLGLSKTKVEDLPLSIRRLHNMQTLDLEYTNITELPNWIHKLARLRHILAGRCGKGVRTSKSLMKLKELQTLETVEASTDFTNNIVGSLTQIRSIGISKVENRNSETLFRNLSRLGSLSSLAVSANDVDVVLPVASLTQKQLKSLELSTCKLEENAVELLAENLSNLVSLTLSNVSGITMLAFQKNYFTKLRELNLLGVHDVVSLHIPLGALENLQVLHVKRLDKLQKVTDEVKINSVKDLFFPHLVLARNDVAESSSRA